VKTGKVIGECLPRHRAKNDSTLTSAILDRVLHHAETVIIEGKSFRMKDEIDA
jgi:DNA replication protein DnaC